MEKKDKQSLIRWIKFVSFAVLIVGGLNYLLMGLFGFDLIGAVLGGRGSVASRIFYSLFGFGAVFLLTVVLIKVFSKENKQSKEFKKTCPLLANNA